MSDILLQEPVYFSQAGTEQMPLPTLLKVISSISIRLSCDTGDVCDEVEVNIKGCVKGPPITPRTVPTLPPTTPRPTTPGGIFSPKNVFAPWYALPTHLSYCNEFVHLSCHKTNICHHNFFYLYAKANVIPLTGYNWYKKLMYMVFQPVNQHLKSKTKFHKIDKKIDFFHLALLKLKLQ